MFKRQGRPASAAITRSRFLLAAVPICRISGSSALNGFGDGTKSFPTQSGTTLILAASQRTCRNNSRRVDSEMTVTSLERQIGKVNQNHFNTIDRKPRNRSSDAQSWIVSKVRHLSNASAR